MDASRNAAAEWRSFWPLPLAAALGYSTSVIHVYSIGAYIGSLQQEFGWSRAQISAGITIASFGSGIFCVPVGMLVDRLGRCALDVCCVCAAQHCDRPAGELAGAVGHSRNRESLCADDGLDERSRQPLCRLARARVCDHAVRRLASGHDFPDLGDLADRLSWLADSLRGHGRDLGGAGAPHAIPVLSRRSG